MMVTSTPRGSQTAKNERSTQHSEKIRAEIKTQSIKYKLHII